MAQNGQALTPRFGGDNAGLGGVVLSVGSKVTWLNRHNMERKINGYARDNYGVIEFVELGEPEEGTWHEATLVVGKERVFTEGEVRVILRDLLAAAEDGPYMPNYDRMDEMVRLHGLSFDPA